MRNLLEAITKVVDKKTGNEYDPSKEIDKMMRDPEYVAQMKRMKDEKGKGWPERKITESSDVDSPSDDEYNKIANYVKKNHPSHYLTGIGIKKGASGNVAHLQMMHKKNGPPKEIKVNFKDLSEDIELDETVKKIGEYSSADGSTYARVHKLSGEHDEGDPYRVRLYKNNKHYEPAEYFTNDEDDAHGTAKSMVKEGYNELKETIHEKLLEAFKRSSRSGS